MAPIICTTRLTKKRAERAHLMHKVQPRWVNDKIDRDILFLHDMCKFTSAAPYSAMQTFDLVLSASSHVMADVDRLNDVQLVQHVSLST